MAKRTAVLLAFSAAASAAFLGAHRWPVLAGLLAGAFIGVCRFGVNEWILKRIFRPGGEKRIFGTIAAFTINQLVMIPVLTAAYFFDVWLFYGFITGVLTVPAVIMINGMTEAFGITRNHFEQGGD